MEVRTCGRRAGRGGGLTGLKKKKRWSECIKPIVGGDWCMASHMGYVVSGDMTVVLKDGTKIEAKAGDSYSVPSGHDAWTENGVQAVEFQSGWAA